MKELRVFEWCDACWVDGERKSEGTSYAASVGVLEAPELILCPDHLASVLQPLVGLLEVVGVKRSGKAEEAQTTCQECGRTMLAQSLRRHLDQVHGKGEARTPGQGRTEARSCPVCSRTATGGQGLAAHIRAAHPEVSAEDRTRMVQESRGVEAEAS